MRQGESPSGQLSWDLATSSPNTLCSKYWTMHFDGSRQLEGSGAGVVLTSPKGDKLAYVLQLHFTCTNNMAEYEALLHGLRMAKEMNIKRIRCFGDSDLVAQQVSGTWDSKDANMAAYRRVVVTAPVWYPKIWAKFSLFAFLVCIMACI